MRLDSVLDSFYVLGSLWGSLTGFPVCPSVPQVLPTAMYEVARSPTTVTAFVDVNVVPMDTERVLPNQTVLVEGGRITALGPTNKVQVPAGAVRIDGRGQYLIPGLTDMHAHFQAFYGEEALVYNVFSYLAHGVTTVRNLNDIGFNYYTAEGPRRTVPEWFLGLKKPEALSPRLYYPVSMEKTSELAKSLRLDRAAAQMAAAIAEFRAAGYDYFAVQAEFLVQLPRDERVVYDSLLTIARRLGFTASSHMNGESFEQMLAYGAHGGSVEHLYAFRDTLAGPEADVSEAEIQAVAAATKRAGTWMSVTLDCVEERKKPPIIGVSRRLVKAMQDAGVGLLLGIDADGAKGYSPGLVNEELKELVRAGLTPYQALLTGTRNAAQFFGILDSSGTVAVGKRADLVLLRGNPLADIRHIREPVGVMLAGRWFDRRELDQRLLASPKEWVEKELQAGIMPQNIGRAGTSLKKFQTLLIDSLKVVTPSDRPSYERLLRQMADELGAARASLTPEQREAFDPIARVWLREQARQGYSVMVTGVTATP